MSKKKDGTIAKSKTKDFYIVCSKKMANMSSEKDRHIRHLKSIYNSIENELIGGKPVTYHKLARRLNKPGAEVVIDNGMIITRARFTQLEIPMGNEQVEDNKKKC